MSWLQSPVLRNIAREQERTIRFAIARIKCQLQQRKTTLQNQEIDFAENYFPKLNLLFIHIPKTAGTSIHQMLSETESRISGSINYTEKHQRPNLHKHATAAQWRDVLGEDIWEKLYTFCLVRNPWELMVSSYYWWLQRAKIYPHLIRDALIVEEFADSDAFMHSPYGLQINEVPRTMSEWYSERGNDLVDYIGSVENLDQDIWHVLQHSNASIDPPSTVRTNVSQRGGYRDYYSESGRKLVEQRFYDVIERFGYKF